MKLEIVKVYDRGDLAKERIHLRALVDTNLDHYVILDSSYVNDKIYAGSKSCYWFGSKEIKAGENVILYTRAGKASSETKSDNQTYHFIFRGLAGPLYGSPESCASLLELQTWETTKKFS